MNANEERLDALLATYLGRGASARHVSAHDAHLAPLVEAADRLGWAATALPSTAFARDLEARMFAHAERIGRARLSTSSLVPRRVQPARTLRWAATAAAVLLIGTGTLTAAASAAGPGSPLAAFSYLEENVRLEFSHSPTDRAQVHMDYAKQALDTIRGGANGATYDAALAQLDTELASAQSELATLPAGASRDHLAAQLATLQAKASQTLQGRLPHLGWTDRLVTTHELGTLGIPVPTIQHVAIESPDMLAKGTTSPALGIQIEISGSGFQPGAALYLNGQPVDATLTVTPDSIIAHENAIPTAQITSVGISNPDGTAANATITRTGASGDTAGAGNQGNGNGSGPQGTPGSNGNGHNPDNAPTSTPSAKGNGHGHNATPTPDASEATPTPHATHTPH